MTAATGKPLSLTPEFRAELREVEPLDLDAALRVYAAHVKDMTDDQLAAECRRVESLPGGRALRLVDREREARLAEQHAAEVANHAALVALMAPPALWTVMTR